MIGHLFDDCCFYNINSIFTLHSGVISGSIVPFLLQQPGVYHNNQDPLKAFLGSREQAILLY